MLQQSIAMIVAQHLLVQISSNEIYSPLFWIDCLQSFRQRMETFQGQVNIGSLFEASGRQKSPETHDISIYFHIFPLNQEWSGLEESHPPNKKWIVQKDYGISDMMNPLLENILSLSFKKYPCSNLDFWAACHHWSKNHAAPGEYVYCTTATTTPRKCCHPGSLCPPTSTRASKWYQNQVDRKVNHIETLRVALNDWKKLSYKLVLAIKLDVIKIVKNP